MKFSISASNCVFRKLLVACSALILVIASTDQSIAQAEKPFETEQQVVPKALEAINVGKIRQGLESLYSSIKYASDHNDNLALYSVGTTVVEILIQSGSFSEAETLLGFLDAKIDLKKTRQSFEWVQYSYSRILLGLGKREAARPVIEALIQRDQQIGFTPQQRGGLRLASQIALEDGKVRDAAFLVRRSMGFAAHSDSITSDELFDILIDYTRFLVETRRTKDARKLFQELWPLYDQRFPQLNLKRLKFFLTFLFTLNQTGEFQASAAVGQHLNEAAEKLDLDPFGLKLELTFQNFYKGIRSTSDQERRDSIQRLLHTVNSTIGTDVNDWGWVTYAYLLVLADEFDTADRVLGSEPSVGASQLTAGYRLALKALTRAKQNDIKSAFALLPQALKQIESFHNQFETESNGSLPSLLAEEKVVLGQLLSFLTTKAQSEDEIEAVFQLQQFLVRDKSSLGVDLNSKMGEAASDFQREEMKSEAAIREDMDSIMQKIAAGMIAYLRERRTGPVFEGWRFKTVLDQHETRLRQLQVSRQASQTLQIKAQTIKQMLQPHEAFLIHSGMPDGTMVTSCITSQKIFLHAKKPTTEEARQLLGDEKLLNAAVRGTHSPSHEQDSAFPLSSAHRIYSFLFSHLKNCLERVDHLILASDPDLFLLPWNALVVELPSKPETLHKEVRWLGKELSFALMPNARAFVSLRQKPIRAQTPKEFLGVANPNYKVNSSANDVANISRPRFVSRDADLAKEIAALSPLPETELEVLTISRLLGPSKSDVLLRDHATERSIRRINLLDYRIVSFATHAIVAGELQGITEPAIVLTPGAKRSLTKNDGLLMASEIAALKLDADLVILSACNTAAGDVRRGGLGLSGLADAFFAAGARTIAVTQWSIISETAAKMGALLVSQVIENPAASSSHSLRSAIRNYISTVELDYYAHPRFWAAYVIAGDSGVRHGATAPNLSGSQIALEPHEFASESSEREFRDGLLDEDGNAIFLSMHKRPDQPIFGSMLSRATTQGATLDTKILDFAGRILGSGGGGVVVGGYLPESGMIFSKFGRNFELVWSVQEQSTKMVLPVAVHFSSGTWTFAAIEYSNSNVDQSTLLLMSVDDRGKVLRKVRSPIVASLDMNRLPSFAVHGGRLFIAVTTNRSPPRSEQNPFIGGIRHCSGEVSSSIVEIDFTTFTISTPPTDLQLDIARLKIIDASLYFLGAKRTCGTSSIVIGSVDKGSVHLIYEKSISNSLEPHDFARIHDGWLIVGMLDVYLPFLGGEAGDKSSGVDFNGDDIWDMSELQASAFALLTNGKSGLEVNRVLSDNTHRSFKRIVPITPTSGIILGNTAGDRSWRKNYNLN